MVSGITVGIASASPFLEQIQATHSQSISIHEIDAQVVPSCEVVILDQALASIASSDHWLSSNATVLVCPKLDLKTLPDSAISLPDHIDSRCLSQLIRFAAQHSVVRGERARLQASLESQGQDTAKLIEVGIALSVEPDLDRLLEKILSEGQRLVDCDAASLFLIDRKKGEPPVLRFKLTQNQSVPALAFEEHTIPLSETSIVGHTALTGEVVNIEDAYHTDPNLTYQFNRSFDKVMGYRTVSLVAIPMLDHHQEIVGVLEFINRKKDENAILRDLSIVEKEVIAFDDRCIDTLRALASQAAVAIENRKLLDDIGQLFDGFVNASVFAIEQRDPCTSGHSFRVAGLSELLAMQVSDHGKGMLSNVSFNVDQLRELRFAALLHDFGKVGVREDVLTKAKKLTPEHLELIECRIAMAKQQLQNQHYVQMISIYEREGKLPSEIKLKMEQALHKDCALLDHYLEVILSSNEPSMMPKESLDSLAAIKSHLFTDHRGSLTSLISEREFASLSIPRGSLNDSERREIESHVTHTFNFLSLIPWTSELRDIPAIAGAHHEKMDGSGYPNHIKSEDIPFQSRIMTVCDIYDALTASDRPYKPAMEINRALSILESEAESGLLDKHIVDLFINAKVYTKPIHYRHDFSGQSREGGYAHHVCDFDLHPHRHN